MYEANANEKQANILISDLVFFKAIRFIRQKQAIINYKMKNSKEDM